ncbi:Arm DNA-binding domain-containing protein [Tamlana fucoidanivorans]|uniref:Arm DNA-binding domain-containing protein n=1 Tax=Allotamlana fucoidanivorans TaxID=2583814 RepID=UPI0026A5442A|nr:Arm DNA-binding domain-containing protein [Tamlana fucoidanivorans]
MKSKNTFFVIFFTRKSRSNPVELSIYVRITVNGKRSEISLKRSVLFKDWDCHKSRAKGSSSKIKTLNLYLDEVFGKLLNCHKELLIEDAIVSSDSIKSRYLGEDKTSKTLRDLISYHHDKMGAVLKPEP